MNILYIIIGILVLVGATVFLTNLKENLEQDGKSENERENIGKYYYLKKSFFTFREKPFFDELSKQNNNEFIILSKVRMEDIVGVGKGNDIGKRYREMRNHIKSRHVDFAVLNKDGKILAVIEVDDKSHNTEKANNGDQIKNDIFGFVGIKFYRVKVGEVYSERIKDIFLEINKD